METRQYITPDTVTGEEIRECRHLLGMTQKEFALFSGVSKPTVERWEQSRQPLHGPATWLTSILFYYPELKDHFSIPEQELPLRMWYMYKSRVCTLIDADMLRARVRIKNYHPNSQFCAFGKDTQPTYEAFEAFLESRCFPRERDKMKLVLRELDIPFYDPLLIIEKTQGRMAEDDFCLRIER